MKYSPTRLASAVLLPSLLVLGITSGLAEKKASTNEEGLAGSSGDDAEVVVTVVVPEGETLTGTAIITLQDITLQDAPSVELARETASASTLGSDQTQVAVPVDLSVVKPNASINVAVHIDADDDGSFSNGDWISDSVTNVITNDKMVADVAVVQIGAN